MIGMDNASLEEFALQVIELAGPVISTDYPEKCCLCKQPRIDEEQARLVYEMACGLVEFLTSHETN